MKRSEFFKRTFLGLAGVSLLPHMPAVAAKPSTDVISPAKSNKIDIPDDILSILVQDNLICIVSAYSTETFKFKDIQERNEFVKNMVPAGKPESYFQYNYESFGDAIHDIVNQDKIHNVPAYSNKYHFTIQRHKIHGIHRTLHMQAVAEELA